jgi:RNA polymerase primary sigma factor
LDTFGLYLREVRRIPLLTPAQEAAFARRLKRGDRTARDALIRHNLRFVVWVAKRYARCGVPLEDLVNEGNLGLVEATRRFDIDRGVRFLTYANWWVKQAILAYLGRQSRDVRLPVNWTSTLARVTKELDRLTQELGREPTSEELARRLRMPPETVKRTLALRTGTLSVDARAPAWDGEALERLRDDVSSAPDEAAVEATRRQDVAATLALLDPRAADILKRYYGLVPYRPQTLAQIGEVYQVTRERVRQIRIQALARLRESSQSGLLAEHAGVAATDEQGSTEGGVRGNGVGRVEPAG